MLFFRSEEHVDRWCSLWHQPRGGLLSLQQIWGLARAWYSSDRRDLQWRRKTPDEAQELFSVLGLTGSFWRLRP
ncbi:MAG: hypothetical protein IT330_04680 [Anaerolineae bacterium]|nr:hypothetical protein [Anaerolineae bacterium]